MALPTHLQLVNNVLVRMREPEVTTVQENTLSKLVSRLVNDAKTQVENAYNWNALTTTLSITTSSNTYGYVLTGAGQSFKVIDVHDVTGKYKLRNATTLEMSQYLLNAPTPGNPGFYNFNGVHTTGDTKVDIYPIPNAAYLIYFNLYIPQSDLVNDSDTMLVPSLPVVLGAFARALVERGEDGGLNSSEAYSLYRAALSDAISIEASRYCEEEGWEAV